MAFWNTNYSEMYRDLFSVEELKFTVFIWSVRLGGQRYVLGG